MGQGFPPPLSIFYLFLFRRTSNLSSIIDTTSKSLVVATRQDHPWTFLLATTITNTDFTPVSIYPSMVPTDEQLQGLLTWRSKRRAYRQMTNQSLMSQLFILPFQRVQDQLILTPLLNLSNAFPQHRCNLLAGWEIYGEKEREMGRLHWISDKHTHTSIQIPSILPSQILALWTKLLVLKYRTGRVLRNIPPSLTQSGLFNP